MSYKKIIVYLVMLSFFVVPAIAKDHSKAAKNDKQHKAKKQEKEYPDFKEVTEGMEKIEGFFTLWHYPESAKGKDKEKLLCQVPSKLLGKKFMLSTSFSGGGFFTGFPLDERVVQWEVFGKQLLLVEPQTGFVVDEKSTVSDVVKRTHQDRILATLPIITKSGNDPLIELGKLLKSEFANIGWTMWFSRDRGKINPQLSRWKKKKTFPGNVEICVELAIRGGNPPGSHSKKLVHYSFWELKKTNYKSRKADDRVGYFLTTNRDWSKPTSERDIFNRYINRWNLVKRDPSLELCEPVKPIVFYIEKTVPVRFRRAIRDGILEWNKAFEKIGFLNAIQVRQQTKDNEWKDLDPEDMRYSFFRWIVTGWGFAMGPHRANPFTGEIYDADIVFDDSMVRYFEQQADRMLPSTALEAKMSNPAIHKFLEDFPQWQKPFRQWMNLNSQEPDMGKMIGKLNEHMFEKGNHCCDYMEGMKHQMALSGVILADQPKEILEKFLYEIIKEVACHEVGHTLGLRHNFAASSVYKLQEIKERRKTNQATSSSVMDYNPVLFFKEDSTEGNFITPTIGPYDYWAIEYGYKPFDSKNGGKKNSKVDPNDTYLLSLKGEDKMLHDIASRSAEPELIYLTDEDTFWVFSPDPRSNRFDMGDDPVEWARNRIELIDHRLENLLDWGSKKGESWYHTKNAFVRLMFEKTFVLDYVGRYAGGLYFTRSHRADPNSSVPFVVVDSELQRKALKYITDTMFRDEFFTYSPEVLNHLAPSRWWHSGMYFRMNFITADFPIHEYIRLMQWWQIIDRLFPYTLRRVHDSELKTSDPDKLTVAEYLQTIQGAIWESSIDADAAFDKKWTNTKPFISDIRRSLQREYLDLMEILVLIRPGWILSPDLHAMIWSSLDELKVSINKVLENDSLDFASKAHLKACKSRIERILEAEIDEWGY